MPIVFDYNDQELSNIGKELDILASIFNQKLPYQGSFLVEIILNSKEEIQLINNKYREIDKPTDVLSFPVINLLEENKLKNINFNLLGSIIICPDIMKENGDNYINLIEHGLIHLFGYDHDSDLSKWLEFEKIILCSAKEYNMTIEPLTKELWD